MISPHYEVPVCGYRGAAARTRRKSRDRLGDAASRRVVGEGSGESARRAVPGPHSAVGNALPCGSPLNNHVANTEYRILGTGCSLLVTRYSLLVTLVPSARCAGFAGVDLDEFGEQVIQGFVEIRSVEMLL